MKNIACLTVDLDFNTVARSDFDNAFAGTNIESFDIFPTAYLSLLYVAGNGQHLLKANTWGFTSSFCRWWLDKIKLLFC